MVNKVGTGVLGYQTAGLGQFDLGETVVYDLVDQPLFVVEVSFTAAPTSTPVWTDVSAYLEEFSIKRGRRSELDRFDTGTMTITLINDDRRFEPKYTMGVYYPNVKPQRAIRVSVFVHGNRYILFTGYVEGWPQNYDDISAGPSHVTVDCSDGFSILAGKKLNTNYSSQLSGFRINAVLTDALWPLTLRNVQDGVTVMQASELGDEFALTHLQLVDASEGGAMFIGANGQLVFRSRHHRFFPPYTVDQGVFGEVLTQSEIPYTKIGIDNPISRVYNEVIFARIDGADQIAIDATSQLDYFTRTLQVRDLLNTNDNEMQDRANYKLSFYKDDKLIITDITLEQTGNQAVDNMILDQMLNRELGDRIRIRHLPPAGGIEINQPSWIEYIEHTVKRGQSGFDWVTKYNVSPVDEQQYWILGDATYGVLGSTTRLSW